MYLKHPHFFQRLRPGLAWAPSQVALDTGPSESASWRPGVFGSSPGPNRLPVAGWCERRLGVRRAMRDLLDGCSSDTACVVQDLVRTRGSLWEARLVASNTKVCILALPGTSFASVYRARLFGFMAEEDGLRDAGLQCTISAVQVAGLRVV